MNYSFLLENLQAFPQSNRLREISLPDLIDLIPAGPIHQGMLTLILKYYYTRPQTDDLKISEVAATIHEEALLPYDGRMSGSGTIASFDLGKFPDELSQMLRAYLTLVIE